MSIAASSETPVLEILPGLVGGPFDFRIVFGNDRPVEIEIGIGKGRFLLEQAAARQEVNFLGIEWSLKYLRLTKDRAQRRGLTNVRLFRADARHVLAALLPDRSIARVHVYCPDPWPKKRHRKRRLFTAASVIHIERVLIPGGYLDLSTDVGEYFDEIRGLLPQATDLREAMDPLFPIGSSEGRTSYEAKYLEAGRAIHRATYLKAADPAGFAPARGGRQGISTMMSPDSTRTP
jgi:tRNA (guanine-N7-)-methyltransferase